MSAGYGMVGEPLPPTRQVRRWCADCQAFTWSVMLDGQELCADWEQHLDYELDEREE